jgi:hypothetical protein
MHIFFTIAFRKDQFTPTVFFVIFFLISKTSIAGIGDHNLRKDAELAIWYLIEIKQKSIEEIGLTAKDYKQKSKGGDLAIFSGEDRKPKKQNDSDAIQSAVMSMLCMISTATNSGKNMYTGRNVGCQANLQSEEVWKEFHNLLGIDAPALYQAAGQTMEKVSEIDNCKRTTSLIPKSTETEATQELKTFKTMAHGILDCKIPKPNTTLSNTVNNTPGDSGSHALPEKETDEEHSTGFNGAEKNKSMTKAIVHQEQGHPSKFSQHTNKVFTV